MVVILGPAVISISQQIDEVGGREGMVMKLGRRLRELREQMGLSQAQLAGHAEVSQGYLCQLEREEVKNPSAAILLRLAKALYVDPHELMDAAGYTPVREPERDQQRLPRSR